MEGEDSVAVDSVAVNRVTGSKPVRTTVELAARRTGMAFQRTRMSADRTLMAVIRTSLSLITFGFAISKFFQKLVEAQMMQGDTASVRSFGISLVALGVGMVVSGILYHVSFMKGLRATREQLAEQGMIHGESHFPVSLTLIIAILLLVLGLLAISSMVFQVAPFN